MKKRVATMPVELANQVFAYIEKQPWNEVNHLVVPWVQNVQAMDIDVPDAVPITEEVAKPPEIAPVPQKGMTKQELAEQTRRVRESIAAADMLGKNGTATKKAAARVKK